MGIKEQQALFRHISNDEYRWYPAHYATHPVIGPDLEYITDGSASAFGTVVATNIATNPSFETASAAVEVRRNLATNPQVGSVVAGNYGLVQRWAGTGGTASNTDVTGATDGPVGTTAYKRKTWTVASTTSLDVSFQFTGGAAATTSPAFAAGVTRTFSYYWRYTHASATVTTNHVRAIFYNSGGTVVGSQVLGATFPDPGSGADWQQVYATFTAPATAVRAEVTHILGFSAAVIPVGTIVEGGALLVEEVPDLRDYFAGNTPAAGDYTYAWTGAANASASIQTAPGVASVTFGADRKAIQSSTWATTGSKSVKIYSDNVSGPSGGGVVGMTLPPGFYTAVATLKIDAPGVAQTGARRLLYNGVIVGSGGTGQQYSDQAPNVPGEYTLRMHFERNATDTEQSVRLLGNGVGEEQSAWWDNLTVVSIPSLAEPYLGPPFNGSTDIPGPEGTRWTGTPHASTSQLGTEVNTTAYPDIPRWPS